MQHNYDILIVGAGLIGNCLVLALQNSGLRVAFVESNAPAQLQNSLATDKTLAISAGSRKILQALNIWVKIQNHATAIKAVHVSDQGHFGKVRLSAKKTGVNALGYVVNAGNMERCVADLAMRTNSKLFCPAKVINLMVGAESINVSLKQQQQEINLSTKLLIGADGGQSSVRRLLNIPQKITDYGQTALVTTIKTSLPHNNIAFERFTANGPLALLPINKQECSVVWTCSHETAKQLILDGEEDFIAKLQRCFGYKLGLFTLIAPRRSFPLSLRRVQTLLAERTVVIGNAANQLHPVAGQGFNLGFRDVARLAEMLIEQQQNKSDIGSQSFLKKYAQVRQKDQHKIIGFTDSIVKVFSSDLPSLVLARGISLAIIDNIPVLKTIFTKHAMGLSGRLPRIGFRK